MPQRKVTSQPQAPAELEMVSVKSSAEWGKWLAKNHRKSPGVWLRIYKKDSGTVTVTYAEALDEALCHGWIDGLRRSHDAASFVQKFTPRRAKSIWSKINTQHIERLSKAGRMKAAGMEAVAAAKSDGRWDAAYDSVKAATIPADFLKEVSRDARAHAFFKSLNRTNQYSIIWRLQTAIKPETRAKRMEAILEMMRQGKKFHP
jgi:uncharacterized protein YdeI (YjbR/CyaY-like superfamily)